MFPSSFQTIFCPTGGDAAPIARAPAREAMRVRVRALTGDTNIAVEVMSLYRRTPAEAAQATDSFAMPTGAVMEVILAPGEDLYGLSSGPPNRVSIHRSAVVTRPSARAIKAQMLTRAIAPLALGKLPDRPIARAPEDAPLRVIVRNLATGSSIFAPAIGFSVEASDLLEPGLANRGYQLAATPGGDGRDAFVLAPGQILYAVALGAVPVPLSILTHDAFVI